MVPIENTSGDATRWLSHERLLMVGAGVTAVGIALSGTVSSGAGGVLILLGWALLAYAIHSLGREGT